MNGLDLFSGIGGLTIALEPWVKPVAYCESDPYSQGVLLSRMRSEELPLAPIWDDVRTLGAEELCLAPGVDIVYGGFPCQDISVAGTGRGLEGERSGLFLHMARLAEEICPAFIFLENVPAIRTRGLSVVAFELARLGYDLRWTTVSAAEVGAPHLRRRWFCLAAHPDYLRKLQQAEKRHQPRNRPGDSDQIITDAQSLGRSEGATHRSGSEERNGAWTWRRSDCRHSAPPWQDGKWWAAEPDVVRVVHGVPARVDRVRGLGNAVVPLQARVAFERLMGLAA